MLKLCHLKIFLNIFKELLLRVRTKPIKREKPGEKKKAECKLIRTI